ncbi:MAG: hypothetical protein ABI912_00390 [Actinomycetota bacterium]
MSPGSTTSGALGSTAPFGGLFAGAGVVVLAALVLLFAGADEAASLDGGALDPDPVGGALPVSAAVAWTVDVGAVDLGFEPLQAPSRPTATKLAATRDLWRIGRSCT